MDKNPNQDLEITGQFAAEEPNPNSEDYLNLGLARADQISSYMINQGVEEDRIIKSYARPSEKDLFTGSMDTIVGGIDLKLVDRASSSRLAENTDDAQDNSSADEAETLTFEPRRLYFETASDYISMDDELRAYLTGVIQYLKQNSDKQLIITGHTDNVGKKTSNMDLGQNRANTVKRYFQEFGLNESQMKATSRGESAPVASNRTESGRQKNRRVEITIN